MNILSKSLIALRNIVDIHFRFEEGTKPSEMTIINDLEQLSRKGDIEFEFETDKDLQF